MLVLRGKQNKNWEQVKKELENQGILFADLRDAEEEIGDLSNVSENIREFIVEKENAELIVREYGIVGVIVSKFGRKEKTMKLDFKKRNSYDNETFYAIEFSIDEEILSAMGGEDESPYEFVENKIEEWSERYNLELLDFGETKNTEIKIPKKATTYNF